MVDVKVKNIKVFSESPAFTLRGFDYNKTYKPTNVSWSDLRNSEVGDKWEVQGGSCGRDCYFKSAEVVYKTSSGRGVLFREYITSDEPNPVDIHREPYCIWYEFS